MARESVDAKADRYLTSARLTIERIEPNGLVVASCRGSEGVYKLGWDPRTRSYRCSCEARGNCAHISALKRVIVR